MVPLPFLHRFVAAVREEVVEHSSAIIGVRCGGHTCHGMAHRYINHEGRFEAFTTP